MFIKCAEGLVRLPRPSIDKGGLGLGHRGRTAKAQGRIQGLGPGGSARACTQGTRPGPPPKTEVKKASDLLGTTGMQILGLCFFFFLREFAYRYANSRKKKKKHNMGRCPPVLPCLLDPSPQTVDARCGTTPRHQALPSA